MTRTEMIAFIKANPYVHITHNLFDSDEYIYSDIDGLIWDENGYLFENWDSAVDMWSGCNGIRMRQGGYWEDGWGIKHKKENCKHQIEIPAIGCCCEAYYKSKRKDGQEWMHFPFCDDLYCPLKHPELLEGATLESE